ncbi:hypothetical protein PWT90_11238 [Aphanocladium album]|nr:hypothetical protein PWT90_11238 [Aphanocladium album]
MAQVLGRTVVQSCASLVEAEERAGCASWAIRDDDSRLIDVALIRDIFSHGKKKRLRDEVREETKSTSFFLDSSYGGTTVVLSFDEAELAMPVIRALRRRGVACDVKKRVM